MNDFETLRIANRRYSSFLKTSCSVLRDCFNINKFYYFNVEDSGRLLLFDSSESVINLYQETSLLSTYSPFCHPKHHRSGCRVIHYDDNSRLSDSLRGRLLQLGYRVLFRITIKSSDKKVEEFGFSSVQADPKQTYFLINKTEELRLWMKWFLKSNPLFQSFLAESSFDLREILGQEFEKDRIGDADPARLLRQNLLRELGISDCFNMNPEDLNTIKLLTKGYSATQIARQLNRSKRTIEHRIEKIKVKLVCDSKIELIEKAQEILCCAEQ